MDDVEIRTVAQVAAVIRRLRDDRAWSQRELAEAAGVSRVFISQLENGKARAEMHLVLAVLQALGASVVVASRETGEELDLSGNEPW